MRWLIRLVVLLVLLIAIYVATAAASLKGMIDDVRTGEPTTIMAWIDQPRLRASLSEQILRAYYGHIEQTRKVKTAERVLGPTIVDAMLAKLLTPETIVNALAKGTVAGDGKDLPPFSLAPLGTSGLENLSSLIVRLRPVSPVQFQAYVDADRQTAIRLHFEGTHWKLSGIDLPPAAIEKLVASLRAR
jgi:hypothetical protein